MKYWLLLSLTLATSLSAVAQSEDRYIDDAYLSRKEVEKRNAIARAEAQARAEARYQARLAEEQAQAAERQRILEAYKQRIRDKEIDAYNGRLSPEDSIELALKYQQEFAAATARERQTRRSEGSVNIYGPYSARLARFHGDGSVIINTSDRVYIDEGINPYGDTNIYIGYNGLWGNSFYPWYDSYYPVYGGSPWWYYSPYSWRYSSWRSPYYRHYRHYDWWYDPFYPSYYGGYYAGYYGSWYDPYTLGYYHGGAARHTKHYYYNDYRDAHRSSSYGGSYARPSSTTAYGAYRSTRAAIESGSADVQYGRPEYSRYGSSSVGSDYRGRGRSGYTGYSEGGNYRGNSSSGYSNSPRTSSNISVERTSSSSSSSYSGSSSSSGSSRSSSSSGGGYRGRR